MSEIIWQKSSFSGGGGEQCIETAVVDGEILMRESDDPDVVVRTTPAKLKAFIAGVKAGEFDHFAS
ncbi:DUF397 domain-containing protein [Streptomyces sp. NPDC059152]|uniref:DUF397 domain-containing protein n=1 Tax=unclassified Streptomyces TaxID=2593676 RepID=UPI000C27BD67|nr:DUF397 domain-containing protein [Streptomyces sp. CB02959]PJN41665.1 DUF397 domain-containing protein [Streptomyces sp. CB02959]